MAAIKRSIFLTALLLTSAHETLLRREFFVVSALYAMNFVGMDGTGGAVYVGNGKIVGMGVGNLRYSGTYIEQSGRIKGTVNLYAPTAGTLVTGAQVPADSRWSLTLDWPANFSDRKPQALMVEDRPAHVILKKIADL